MCEFVELFDDGVPDGSVLEHPRHNDIVKWVEAYGRESDGIHIVEQSDSGCGRSNLKNGYATVRRVECDCPVAWQAFIDHFGEGVLDDLTAG